MIRVNDIFQYTVDPMMGGYTKYYIDEVYEATDEWMVVYSWKEDGLWMRDVRPLQQLEKVLLSGHIRIVGRDDKMPITHIRPHHFNPQLRDIPIRKGTKLSPYYTPKFYDYG